MVKIAIQRELLKILCARVINNSITGNQIMPKRSLQGSPLKKLKVNHKYLDMVKPKNGSSNVQAQHNLEASEKTQNDTNGERNIDVQKSANIKVEYLEIPVKSESDKKSYRTIKLPNGLIALLISDPSPISWDGRVLQDEDEEDDNEISDDEDDNNKESGSDESCDDEQDKDENNIEFDTEDGRATKEKNQEEKMAACSLTIGVGSFSDPPEVPGLAHFLEHMVFMGSKKYPQENEFDSFIQKHGGYDNAETDCEHTSFYFEIQEQHLFSALDRFAPFFINPLMKRDAIAREREAVDSEFQQSLPSDHHRKVQLISSLAQTRHPVNKFLWGNLITLRDNIEDHKLYEELHKFRERHYSAHRMTLAIQARLPLDTLEKYVIDHFSNVPNNGLPADDFSEFNRPDAFITPRFARMYKVQPIKDVCQVVLTWIMPSLHHLYKSKPHQYVSWIIGHEGKGSLTSYLRKKMWALELNAGIEEVGFDHSSMYGLFNVSIELTREGAEHLKEVIDAIYSYIKLMQRAGPQKRIFDELCQIEKTNFRFVQEESPDENVQDLSVAMHFYPPVNYINGSDLYFEYNPVAIKAFLDALTADKVNIMVIDKKFNDEEFEKVEPWFSTKYTDMEIPMEWRENWNNIEPMPEFHLPESNNFITDDFTLLPVPEDLQEIPIKIHSDYQSEIWYKPDAKFRRPECCAYFHYMTPLLSSSPENAAMLDLFVRILEKLFVEEMYPARSAGLNLHLYPSDRGLMVEFSGFNQKIPLLMETMTKYIADCWELVTEDLFNVMKVELLKAYYNTFLKPEKLVKDTRLSILMLVHWTTIDKHAAISQIGYKKFKNFANYFTDHIYVKCLVQGNITKDDAIHSVMKCIKLANCGLLLPHTMPSPRVTEIPIGTRCCRITNFNSTDANSVVENYYQFEGGSIELSIMLDLLDRIMEEPLFEQLRTQEQLGYDVSCLKRDTNGVLGFTITVNMQATKHTPEFVDDRIEAYLETFETKLKEMSEKDLEIEKESLTKIKLCADYSLKKEVSRNWDEIVMNEYIFDRKTREVDAIRAVKIEELREFWAKHTMKDSHLRKLSIQVVGNDHRKPKLADATEPNDTGNASSVSKRKRNATTEYSDEVQYPLEYITDLPTEKTKKTVNNYYITNIENFKRSLRVYPVQIKKLATSN